MDIARMILSELTLRKLPKIPSFSVHLGKIYWEAYKACRRQWDAEELERVQTKKLRAMVKHAYEHVYFYKNRFDDLGISPEKIKKAEDLSLLPTMGKQELRMYFPELIAVNFPLGSCNVAGSSGSTGEFSWVLKDRNNWIYDCSALIRCYLACGIGFCERTIGVEPMSRAPQVRCSIDYYNGFQKICYLPTWEKDENIDYIGAFAKFKPTIIEGAPSTIKPLADAVNNKNRLHLRLKAVISSFESLDKNTQEYFRRIFSCDVFDFYRASECNLIAWTCQKHEGYHIDMDNVIVEFLKDGIPVSEGEMGEIVVTPLNNYAMPLIRYKIGDVGTFTHKLCSCGRKLPLIEMIEGRTINFIVLSDGQIISQYDIRKALNHPAIIGYQVVQESTDLIIVSFIKGTGFTSELQEDIENRFRLLLKNMINVEFLAVDTLLRAKSGKLHCVISKVPNPYFR